MFMKEYVDMKLEEWENCKMTTWESKMKVAYGRRKYLHAATMERASRLTVVYIIKRLMREAETMDLERESKGKSFPMYIT